MWLTLLAASVGGLFSLGQKWSKDNAALPDPITQKLDVIQFTLSDIGGRVSVLEQTVSRAHPELFDGHADA